MALFLKMHGQWRRKNTCVYCGEVAGHKQDCPYDYHNREDPPKG